MNYSTILLNTSNYFFEVLITHYKDLENIIDRDSKITKIFSKIDYSERKKACLSLKERANEALENIPTILEGNYEKKHYNFHSKLCDCIETYILMLEAQIEIQFLLEQKSNGFHVTMNDYLVKVKHYNYIRNTIDIKLQQLVDLYPSIIF